MLFLTTLSLFLTVLLLVVGLYRSTSRFAVEKRIEQIMVAESQTAEEELEKPFVQRVLLPLGDAVAKIFRGAAPAEVAERTQKKLVMAGLYPRVTPVQLLGLSWFSAAGCVLLMFLLLVSLGSSGGGGVRLEDPVNLLYLLIGAAS